MSVTQPEPRRSSGPRRGGVEALIDDPHAHPQAGIWDPSTAPEISNAKAREVITPEIPLMPPLPSDTVELPGGYIDHEGTLHREARVREVNGADEEAMGRELRSPTVSVVKVVDILLKRCVLEVGPHKATPQLLGEMLAGDRAAMMLAIRVLTFGRDWEVEDFPCRLCGQTFGTVVELDSIESKKMENPMVQEIEVELRNGHTANVALLTGSTQLRMGSDTSRTAAEDITVAIDSCLRRFDGAPITFPMAQRLGMADRRTIAQAMGEGQPGPKMEEVMVTCTQCGQEAAYSVSLLDLFR